MMLPPIDGNVLKNNPRFQKLYGTLTAEILNPDASTKNDPGAQERDSVRQALQAHRLKAARLRLLRSAISTAMPPSEQHQQRSLARPQYRRAQSRPQTQSQVRQQPSLPPDLVQLLLLLPPFLEHASTMPPSSVQLLLTRPPFSDLAKLFPALLETISTRLGAQASTLARVLSPATNASYLHRVIPTLPSLAETLVTGLETSKAALSQSRLRTAAAVTAYLQRHTDSAITLLEALEGKHGVAGESASLRARKATQAAQAWALAARALLAETTFFIYPPSARSALLNYSRHLGDAGRRLEDAARVREAELADYGVSLASLGLAGTGTGEGGTAKKMGSLAGTGGSRAVVGDENKERTMREMARVWREMENRLREVQGDLHRLR